MDSIQIPKTSFSHLIKKTDVWLVFTIQGKCWICRPNGMLEDGGFYILELAPKKGGAK